MRRKFRLLQAGALVFAGLVGNLGQSAAFQGATAPDNTKVNKQDRASSEPTADKAKDNRSDREIMQQIRKAVMDDKSLSTYGHNVKIIAQRGRVTLKGPVHSEEEKKSIEAKAAEVAGGGNVINQLTVKGDKNTGKYADK